METIFEQKKRGNIRKYTLYSDKILIETENASKKQKYELKLDKLGHNIFYQSESMASSKGGLYFSLSCPIFAWIIYFLSSTPMAVPIFLTFVCLILVLIILFRKREDDIYLTGSQNSLVFFRTTPSEESVLDFIHKVINTSKAYLRNKYGIIDTNIPEDVFLARLNWLKEEEIISEKEFCELKDEYRIKKIISQVCLYKTPTLVF